MDRRYHPQRPTVRQRKRRRVEDASISRNRVFGGSCTSNDKRINGLLQRRGAPYDDIVKVVLDEGALNLNTFNQVTALHRLARHNVRDCSATEALATALEAKVPVERMSSRHLCNLAWCAAKIDRSSLLVAVASVCDLEDFNAQDTSNFLWACAKCRVRPRKLTGELLSRLTSSSTAQGVSNAAWAVATLGDYYLLDALEGAIGAKIKDFNAQEIANVAWALAKGGRGAHFARLADRAVDLIDSFTAQNMSNMVWACATTNYRHDNLMSMVASRLVLRTAKDAQTVSNAAWAYAKLKYFFDDLFASLAECGMSMISSFTRDQQHLTHMVWAYSKYYSSRPVADLVKPLICELTLAAIESASQLTSKNLCVVLHSLATVDYAELTSSRSSFFDAASTRFASVAANANAQDVSHVSWAFATIGRDDAAVFDEIENQLPRLVADFNPQNVANVAWALAKSGRGSNASFDLLKGKVLVSPSLSDYQPQNLANLLYSFALARFERLYHRNDEDLFDAVGGELSNRKAMCAQDTANAAWAFARVRRDHPLLRKIVVDSSFNSQNLANVAWALASLNLGEREAHVPCLDPLIDQIESRLDIMRPQELATCAYALAKIFSPCKQDRRRRLRCLYTKLECASLASFDSFNAQDVCTTLWGFAALDIQALNLFGAVRLNGDFDNPRLSTVAWAFAKSEFEARHLFDDIKARVEWTKLETHEFSHLVWAFAAQAHDVQHIFDAYDAALSVHGEEKASHALLKRMKPCQHACVLWALAAAGDEDRLRHAWSLLVLRRDESRSDSVRLDAYDVIARSQLQQARLVAGLEVPDGWGEPLRDALAKVDCRPNQGSHTQHQLSLRLAQIVGWDHVYEHVDEFGLSLDMADPANKQAIEFDGPTHYFANIPTKPTARCALKRRLLRETGWNTIHFSSSDDLSSCGLEKILRAENFRLEKKKLPLRRSDENVSVSPAEEESPSDRECRFPGAPKLLGSGSD